MLKSVETRFASVCVMDCSVLLVTYITITCQKCVIFPFLSCCQIHHVFMNRWSVFHAPVMTVDLKVHPEFYHRDTDEGTDKDFDKVIQDLAKSTGTPSVTRMKLQYEEMRIV